MTAHRISVFWFGPRDWRWEVRARNGRHMGGGVARTRDKAVLDAEWWSAQLAAARRKRERAAAYRAGYQAGHDDGFDEGLCK